jgi:hypothetical protein
MVPCNPGGGPYAIIVATVQYGMIIVLDIYTRQALRFYKILYSDFVLPNLHIKCDASYGQLVFQMHATRTYNIVRYYSK